MSSSVGEKLADSVKVVAAFLVDFVRRFAIKATSCFMTRRCRFTTTQPGVSSIPFRLTAGSDTTP